MSSRSPNLQQIPSINSPYGKECRELFIPTKGYVMVGADASSLEARCLGHYIKNYTDYSDKIAKYNVLRKQMTKDKAIAVDAEGYHKYFILDGKKLDIQNFDMNQETVKKGTASELKRIFGKSMQNRLVSRVVLNKFIQEVA